eukprot:15475396-Alexandrium_andersonii.AAC.1
MGPGMASEVRKVFGSQSIYGSEVAEAARYLGAMHHAQGRNEFEVRKRLRVMDSAFYAMGSFWQCAPRKFARQ